MFRCTFFPPFYVRTDRCDQDAWNDSLIVSKQRKTIFISSTIARNFLSVYRNSLRIKKRKKKKEKKKKKNKQRQTRLRTFHGEIIFRPRTREHWRGKFADWVCKILLLSRLVILTIHVRRLLFVPLYRRYLCVQCWEYFL